MGAIEINIDNYILDNYDKDDYKEDIEQIENDDDEIILNEKEIEEHIKEIEEFEKNIVSLDDFFDNIITLNQQEFLSFIKKEEFSKDKSIRVIGTFLKNKLKNKLNKENEEIINFTNEKIISILKKSNNEDEKELLLDVLLFKNLKFIYFFIKKEFNDIGLIDGASEDLYQSCSFFFLNSIKNFDINKGIKFSSFVYYQLFRGINYVERSYFYGFKETNHDKRKLRVIVKLLIEYFGELEEEKLIYERVSNEVDFLELIVNNGVPKKSIFDGTLHKAIDTYNGNYRHGKSNFLDSEIGENSFYYTEDGIEPSEDFDDSSIKFDFIKKLVSLILGICTYRELFILTLRFGLLEVYGEEIIKLFEEKSSAIKIEINEKNIKKLKYEINSLKIFLEERIALGDKKRKLSVYMGELKQKEKELNELISDNKFLKKQIIEEEKLLTILKEINDNQGKKIFNKKSYFTLEEVSGFMKCTRERIRQIEARMFENLKRTVGMRYFLKDTNIEDLSFNERERLFKDIAMTYY